MTDLLEPLKAASRLLFEARLKPLQGTRFYPTHFADLGPAEYTLPDGTPMLLVESVQSVANHLEKAIWDEAAGDVVPPLRGLPYVRALLAEGSGTNSILEAHRLNSPYIEYSDETFLREFRNLVPEGKPANLKDLPRLLFKYDPCSLLHGVFLESIDGRLRVPRSLAGFIEARNARVAASGGVKNDRVDPRGRSGGAEAGFGHVPFHRREFTAGSMTGFFNLDLTQVRSYGMGENAERFLVLLALYKIRRFLEQGLRLRSACDLGCEGDVRATFPAAGFEVPSGSVLGELASTALKRCKGLFADPPVTEVRFDKSKARARRRKEDNAEEES